MTMQTKRQAARPHGGPVRWLVLLLCVAVFFSSVSLGRVEMTAKAAGETVTVTVNYVYRSNNTMVAQPYTAQIEKGAAFQKTLQIPQLFNYSVPTDEAVGLGEGIELSKDEASGRVTLAFALDAVEEDVTVTLYYVAGTAKYTVYHYYQNLENDDYAQDPKVVELTGDIDAYTQAVANNKHGYRCKGVPQTTIAADGSTKVEIYYDREFYTAIFDVNGGINGPEPIYAKYGTTFKAKDIKEPRREGYTFLGWRPELEGTVTITDNVTYTAQWQPKKGQADYTIVIWGQNANDDEYSYLGSHEAWGNVGNEITWDENTLISHVHTDDCWALTCGKETHTHTEACLNCTHTHDMSCYGGTNAENPIDADIRQFADLFGSLQNGYVYRVRCNAGSSVGDTIKYDKYYLYFNGTWYLASATACDGGVVKESDDINAHDHSGYIFSGNNKDHFWAYKAKLSCTHTHVATCYSCGKEEHTHTSACGTLTCGQSDTPKRYMRDIRPDDALWKYERSDTVTVNADRSTVLNVYFVRKEFTLSFRQKYSDRDDYGTITARWGKNIADEYHAIVKTAGSSFWSENRDAGQPWTNYIGVMPQRNIVYYRYMPDGSGSSTMTYYGEDLNGTYQMIFSLTFAGTNYSVSDEDRYEFEGFTYDHGSENNAPCDGAKFYYRRNGYTLNFYSASNSETDRSKSVKYQNPLGQYDYDPTDKPSGVEPDAIFVGWYLNPQRTGERFDLGAHTMPSHDIALYAKWVNGLYTVRTFTDDAMQSLYTYDGYTGVQMDIEKYALATAPTAPQKDGHVFVGWFYRDGDTEKIFSFTMPITRNYDLYPKFSQPMAVEYTVHYYKEGTTQRVASDETRSVQIGTTVTEKAKMGKELDLLPEDQQNRYYPTNTGTSEIIHRSGQEITFYYKEAASMRYTVYYRDANGKDLHDPVTRTTESSTVTENYVPIPNHAPRQYSITQDLSSDAEQNVIVFIYDPTLTTLTIRKTGWAAIDEGQTFLFTVRGTDGNTCDVELTVTVHGNGKTTVAELPVGSYTVTEMTDWSWCYTPEGGAAQTVTAGADGAELTFANGRTEEKWLDGGAFTVNLFGVAR